MLSYYHNDLISNLNLSTRTYNVLKREGIHTINDLLNLPQKEISKFKNLGKKSLDEIFFVIEQATSNKTPIYTQINEKTSHKAKSFISFDGNRYYDIPVEDLNLSVRAFNCLKKENIRYYSELICKSSEELINISNIGKNTVLELENVKSNTQITLFNDIKENERIIAESISINIFKLINEKFTVYPTELFESINQVCLRYVQEKEFYTVNLTILEDLNFILDLYQIKYIKSIFKKYILNLIIDNIYGCDYNYIIEKMPKYFNIFRFVNLILDDLISDNKIQLFNENKYIATFPSFIIGTKNILTEKEYNIIIQRTQGKTLEEVGTNFRLTRERIRQIEAKAINKLNQSKCLFKEDIYSDIFKRYLITQDEFFISFKNSQAYYYLSIRYNPSKSEFKYSKLPLEKILEDKQIPILFKRACEKAIFRNYAKIGKEYVPCTREDISNYILRTFSINEITFGEFRELYFSTLEDIGKENDPNLCLMDRGYENKLAASKNTLWKYGKKFRYYNIDLFDFTELFNTLNLYQYNNVEYSTQKLFKLHTELMKNYDIQDEYELHNLLKKICKKENYPTLKFKRMPNIEFGTADRDNQVMELLETLAPISNDDFAKEYENEYGVAKNTVLANYMTSFDKYFYNGIYKIDFPILSNSIVQRLKQLLINDFYMLENVRAIYKKEFPYLDKNLLNPFSLKSIGFRVYSNYAIKDNYNSATEYFNYLLTKDDITCTDNLPTEIKNLVCYTAQLYKLKADYEIIEFSPNNYIHFNKLKKFGITKDMLKCYCRDVLKFVGESRYFTLNSLRKDGFLHELDDLGFDEWFYTSILVEDKNNLSYQRIGGNKVMLKGKFNVLLEEFIEYIVYNQDTLYMDIYELSSFLKSYYNVSISPGKLVENIRNSSMFYDAISEKVYADYDIYYEEI